MSDTLEQVEEQTQVQQVAVDPFTEASWVENPLEQKPLEQSNIIEKKEEPIIEKKEEDEEIFDANEYLKSQLGYDNWETIKADIEDYKKLKGTPKDDIKFANDDSKRFFDYMKDGKEDDLYNFLSEKKRLEKFTAAEINEQNAADIIKLAMQKKYKEFTPEEVEYKFKKQFSIPKEPIMGDLDDEAEFAIKKQEWEAQVRDIKMDMMIEAKLARPELEKLKSELVLPDIKGKEPVANEPTAEELQKVQELRVAYLDKLNSGVKNFNGFEVRYKDEDVEIPVQFIPSEEEKTALKNELETFDLEDFILTRWFDENGQPKVKELMEDVYELKNRERIHQKIATETAAKVRDNYMKKAKNISLNGAGGSQFQQNIVGDKSEMDKVAEFFLSQK